MTEEQAIKNSTRPVTRKSLAADFSKLGITPGTTLLVHSSLSSLGWVCGGPVAVIQALLEVITEKGTLIMPTFSEDNSDPADWSNPAVPESWWETIRQEMPAYHPEITPVRGVGAIPETFRKFPGVIRSAHPCMSFAARGARAAEIIADHKLDYPLNEDSPLGAIYQLEGQVLLLGVGHDRNTSLHLAEYLADYPRREEKNGSAIWQNGRRIWTEHLDIDLDSDDFKEVGRNYEKSCSVRVSPVGHAVARIMPQQDLVDYAVSWFSANRSELLSE